MKKAKIVLSIILLFIVSGGILFLSGIFNISSIEVVGNSSITREEIVKSSGIVYGKNILLFSKKVAMRGIFKDPYVKLIKIERKFPNRVVINVVERVPGFKLPYVGSFVILDEEGVVVEVLPIGGRKVELPVAVGLKFNDFKVGDQLKIENKDTFDALMGIVVEIRPSGLLQGMKEIDITDVNNVSITFEDGNEILLGEPIDVANKLSFAKSILQDIKEKNRKGIIDISHMGDPVFRPAN